ncbi:MAG: hypothetical protein ABUL77_04530 [Bacteroidota bacterium]
MAITVPVPRARPGRLVAAVAVVLAVLTAGPVARAADPDPWFGQDKALHFGLSATIAAGGYGLAAVSTERRQTRFLVGGGLALAAGVGKELADAFGTGDASAKDLTWDVLGTATGLGVAWLIDWLTTR